MNLDVKGMTTMQSMRIVMLLLCMLSVTPAACAETDWLDTFYQYRMPLLLDVPQAGWNVIPINEAVITAAINRDEEMTYDPLWLAYNYVKVVELDATGGGANDRPDAGFYLVPEGPELFAEPITGLEQTVTIPTERDAYYLVRYKSKGGGASPLVQYAQIFPIGVTLRKQAYMSSYEPPLLPLALTDHERLLKSDGAPMILRVKDRFITDVQQISVQKVNITFMAHCSRPGLKSWMLYYQPMCGHHLNIPQSRRDTLPTSRALLKRFGRAEKYTGASLFQISNTEDCTVWFADSTVKITPDTGIPETMASAVRISAAKNEAQSFQLMLSPKRAFCFTSITADSLVNGSHEITADSIEFKALDYVPILTRSYVTPVDFSGPIADPLVDVTEMDVTALTGNVGFWITVTVPPATPAGTYHGRMTLRCSGIADILVPLEMKVYDFELPEFASFQSSMGYQYITKTAGADRRQFLQYHGLETKEQVKKIFREYCNIMARNKFYPKTVAMYSEIGMKWSAPPQGYNVDAPDNFFRLYDWDFSEFNDELAYYIDQLKVNSVCLTHTNPKIANMFKHLPGAPLSSFATSPPHITMAWQTFCDHTYVAWGKKPGDAYEDETIEITRKQFDRLLLDYYRAIAENLRQHGWLNRFYIQIDETDHIERVLHFVRLLKSDPLTAQIKIVACMQGLTYLNYKEHPDDKDYAFNGLLTYMPQDDENYQRWEDYFWTDYRLPQGREYLWNYGVTGSRLAIDVPGINNRILALDIFNRGGSGFLIWEIAWWDSSYTPGRNNPWLDPYSIEGNGVLAFFYPPRRTGLPNTPEYTVSPSLRVMTFRESVDDYEYALMLENLISQAHRQGRDVASAQAVLDDIARFFDSSVSWSQNNAWYLDLRGRMAKQISQLKHRLRQ